jgi:hypothetical protein
MALTNGGYSPYLITGRVPVSGTGRGIGATKNIEDRYICKLGYMCYN